MRVLAGLVLVLALFASATLLAGCDVALAEKQPKKADGPQLRAVVSKGVERIDDPARSVTCYALRAYGAYGAFVSISCVGMLPGDDE